MRRLLQAILECLVSIVCVICLQQRYTLKERLHIGVVLHAFKCGFQVAFVHEMVVEWYTAGV